MKHPLFTILLVLILLVTLSQGGWLFPGAAVSASQSDNGVKKNMKNSASDIAGYTADDCIACHTGDGESSLQISLETFNSTAHGKAITCLGCHPGITGEEHMERKEVEPVNCIRCHADRTGEGGIFSKAVSFRIASHPKADFSENYSIEKNCLGCHQGKGAHGEAGAVSTERCYICHATGLKHAMWGSIHPDEKSRSLFTTLIYSALFLFFLIALMRVCHPVMERFFKAERG